MKATARAYAIQGLVKYHGLKDRSLRIPFHDSISVCMNSLATVTTVESDPRLRGDIVRIDGKVPSSTELVRVRAVLDALRERRASTFVRVESRNPEVDGKGLGFSASGFAALGLASSRAFGISLGAKDLSQVVRLGAGSAARSLVGGFSIWYANRGGMSYAEQLAPPSSMKLKTLIVPISSTIKTDSAHEDAVKSPFYGARLKNIRKTIQRMKRAIAGREIRKVCQLAEEDTLSLHAITMTGSKGMVLFRPLSIMVIDEIRRLREEDEVPVWFSLDTGPSVFVNTTPEVLRKVRRSLDKIADDILVSSPGGPAEF